MNIKLKLKSLVIILIFCLSSQNIVSANDSLSNNFLSFEDLAINGSKNYECGEYHLSWIAYLIIEENLKEIKLTDNLNDEQFYILRGLIKTAWEDSDKSNIDCSNAFTIVQNAFDRNQNLYKSENVEDLDDFLKLKTSRSFFGIRLQDKLSNYNLSYNRKWQGQFFERSLLIHIIDAPIPNPIFDHYEIRLHPNLKDNNFIESISAYIPKSFAEKKTVLNNLNNIIEFYINNTDSNFIAGVYVDVFHFEGFSLSYDKYKAHELDDEREMGYKVVIEINNSNEQINLNAWNVYDDNWTLDMHIDLVKDADKVANINQGL